MAQTKPAFDEARIPFNKMTFSPDVPSTALGADEYNYGFNVETDVRGIRSVAGEQEILKDSPGTPTYITGGYRGDGYFWFVVATEEGDWWANRGDNHTAPASGNGGIWININPVGLNETYTQAQNITGDWNGNVPFFNDAQTPPMFWPDTQSHEETTTGASGTGVTATLTFATLSAAPYVAGDRIIVEGVTPTAYNGLQTVTACTTTSVSFLSTATGAQTVAGTISGPIPIMTQYSNILPAGISNIAFVSAGEQQITFDVPFASAPYVAGEYITISGVNGFFNGTFRVVSSTTTTLNYAASPSAVYPGGSIGSVAPEYSWNYNPDWTAVHAGFLRLYTTPNVGSILVAGNLTATLLDGTIANYPVTVQWSQKFGLNQAPGTWEPTVLNVANQLEVPLRGTVLDAFPANGNLYLQSYWDTVVLSPINFTTTVTPILGNRLFNLGRGLLSANCWCNADNTVYGIDARDIWVFDGQGFRGIGNQRVKNWFFDQVDPRYTDRVFMVMNTQKNQVEIYYPTVNASFGQPDRMLSYRTDLDVWNAPRLVYNATFATESPIWIGNEVEYPNLTPTNVSSTGSGCIFNVDLFGTQYTLSPKGGSAGTGYAVGDTLKILGTQVGGATPANDIAITVTDISAVGGIIYTTAVGDASGWNTYNPGSRCVVYARGVFGTKPVQKDQGYSNLDSNPITSEFKRDNIKVLKDYSGKVMVHRILPEVVNLDERGLPVDPATASVDRIADVSVAVYAANSVGQTPQFISTFAVPTNTDNPWAQINQNAYRVNSISLSNRSNLNIWMCNATTWQFTQVEDDR
jgi:hypothetical protein